MQPIWRREQVEDLALITLLEFRRQTGLPLLPPLDVDLVGEITCGLQWDWDILPEPPRTTVWAGLFPRERRVVLNERHKDKFEEKSGLERFTKAHEIGHWVLHVEAGGVQKAPHRSSEEWVYWNAVSANPKSVNWIEKHADWFAAGLLLPANIFAPIAEEFDLYDWRSLYQLARLFDVTISALCIRLSQLGFAHAGSQKSR